MKINLFTQLYEMDPAGVLFNLMISGPSCPESTRHVPSYDMRIRGSRVRHHSLLKDQGSTNMADLTVDIIANQRGRSYNGCTRGVHRVYTL